jgi:hypothetical protein
MTVKFKLREPGPVLTDADISAFEEEIGGRLPTDYKCFLREHNGGLAHPPVGFYWNGKLNKLPAFWRLLPTDESGLRRVIRNLRELDSDGFLSITGTHNNEDICLDFLNCIGSVSIATYTYQNDVEVAVKFVPYCESFGAFLNGLVEMPEPYCPIEDLGQNGTNEDLEVFLTEGHSLSELSKNDLPILLEAIRHQNVPLAEACIERGASLSKALHFAVGNGLPDLVKRLVSAGADINEKDEWGWRPLRHIAGLRLPGEEGEQNRAMHDLLLELGADRADARER